MIGGSQSIKNSFLSEVNEEFSLLRKATRFSLAPYYMVFRLSFRLFRYSINETDTTNSLGNVSFSIGPASDKASEKGNFSVTFSRFYYRANISSIHTSIMFDQRSNLTSLLEVITKSPYSTSKYTGAEFVKPTHFQLLCFAKVYFFISEFCIAND